MQAGSMARRAWIALGWIALGSVFNVAVQDAHADAMFSLRDCRIESSASGSLAARCGKLEVPENRDDPRSRKIALHVAVVPALRVQALPDPLFVLAGGPGQGASDFYASLSAAFGRIRRDRDIVLVDQRGTGRSNRLDCQFDADEELTAVDPAKLQEHGRLCLQSLDADARFYTTSVAVRDLDDVRRALGYDKLNFYAVSYGTRVAQHYLRRYPAQVRTMILDGLVPVDLALGPEVAIQAQRALDALFERCAQDSKCNARFTNVAESFATLRGRLQREPLTIVLPDPLTGELATTTMGLPQLGAAVRLLTYSDETASVLPLLIHRAQVDREPQALLAQYLMIKRNVETQIAHGMHFSVSCSEDAPRWAQERIEETALAQTYLGPAFMQGFAALCAMWPRGPVDDDFNAPLASEVPVLLLSGENDPVTPQEYGVRAARSFARGKHLIMRGQGHGQLANGCMPRVAAEFISLGAVSDLDTRCTNTITPTPFMLSTSATAP